MAKVVGKGTIVQLEKEKTKARCRKWQLRVNSGLNPRTGKYKTHTRRFSGTYTEATKALRTFIEEIENNQVIGRTKYTLQEYCDRYVDRRETNKEIAPATAKKLRSNFKSACAHLGHANLSSITPEMLDDMYLAMQRGDTLSGRPSSGTHVRHIHNNLTLLFNQAIKEEILVTNPCNGANPPRMDTKERHAIEPEKVREFVAELGTGNDNDCAYMLAVCMGMRRGEICGLSWGDVDFDAMTISVEHSVDGLNNLKDPKTKAGKRILPMPTKVAEALKTLRKTQQKRFDKLNRDRKKACHYKGEPLVITDESPVIANISGERLHPTTLSKWWETERATFGLEGVTFHELSHTFITMLALEGVHPRLMQELAGHSDPQTAMKVYTHVNLEAKRQAVGTLDRLFAA